MFLAGNTVTRVTELVQPKVEALGLTLWDVRFVKEGASWYLRIFIDKPGGITIDFVWKDRCITECSLRSQTDTVRTLLYNGTEKKVMLKADVICYIV